MEINIQRNSVYRCLDTDKSRYFILVGSAGSGKSYDVALHLVLKILQEKNHRILLIRQSLRHVKNAQFKECKEKINNMGLNKYFKINETIMSITCLITGSELIAFGGDDPEKIKSFTEPTGAWIEEATQISEDFFNIIDGRIRTIKASLKIYLTFNPINRSHWLKKRFFKDYELQLGVPLTYYETIDGGEVAYTLLRTNYLHNIRFLDKAALSSILLMKERDYNFYKVYALGEWGELTESLIFKRQLYMTYKYIPDDARGVVYCDPNLSKKGKGDTTGLVKLLYSPSAGKYFVSQDSVCRSMSSSEELISLIVRMRQDDRCKAVAMDGNVNQESHWSDHIRNYFHERGLPAPVIEFKNYKVDELAKNAEWAWNSGDILFPEGFENTIDGASALDQLFTFSGKKNISYKQVNGRKVAEKDDFPDALICAIEFCYERGYSSKRAVSDDMKKLLIK